MDGSLPRRMNTHREEAGGCAGVETLLDGITAGRGVIYFKPSYMGGGPLSNNIPLAFHDKLLPTIRSIYFLIQE